MGKGTGLGLSTVLAIVKSHEGFVNVCSEPDRGTIFKVYFPAMETSLETPKDVARRPSPPRGNGETVLVVDDEASVLAVTSQTLEAFGYRTLTARDGSEALAVYAQHGDEIAAVLTDMAMPVMDGAATIRTLMKINPAIKIIVASGSATSGSMDKEFDASIKYFLTKPYTAGTLLRTLRTLLGDDAIAARKINLGRFRKTGGPENRRKPRLFSDSFPLFFDAKERFAGRRRHIDGNK